MPVHAPEDKKNIIKDKKNIIIKEYWRNVKSVKKHLNIYKITGITVIVHLLYVVCLQYPLLANNTVLIPFLIP